MFKRLLVLAVFSLALLSNKLAFAQSGQGVFVVNNCNTISSPVTGGTWCLSPTGPTIGVWNGSAYSNVQSNVPNGTASGQIPVWNGSAYVASSTLTANLNAGGNKITNLVTPTTVGDSVSIQAPVTQTVSGSNGTINCATGQYQQVIVAANTTLTVEIPANGMGCLVDATENGTGGYSIAFAAQGGDTLVWNTSTSPTFTTSANTHNLINFSLNGTNLVGNAGGSGSGGSVPINNAPTQTGTYNAAGQGFTNISSLVSNGVQSSVNQIINVIQPPTAYVNNGFVAKCDGSTDDTTAINGIIYQDGGGIGSFGNNVVNPIMLPPRTATTPSCFHTKPIEIPYGNLTFGGPAGQGNGGSNGGGLSQNYYGAAVIAEGYNSSTPEMTTGPFANTKALVATSVNDGDSALFLTPFLNSHNLTMNGKGGSGFAIDFWWKPTGNDGGFTQPVFAGSIPSPMSGTRAIQCGYTNSYADFFCTLNWSSGASTAETATLPSSGVFTYIRMNCVSGTCTLSYNGVSEATSSYSGTIVENPFDTYLLPSVDTNVWPVGGCNSCESSEGDIAGLRIENASLGNTYPFTAPTALNAGDTNTLLLINFDAPADGVVHPWQQAYIGQSTPNAYISHWNSTGGSTPPFNTRLHDINLCVSGTCEGAVLNWTALSEIDHLYGSFNFIGIQSQDAFEANIHDNDITTVPTSNGRTGVCYQWENAGESDWNHNFCATNGVGTAWNASSGNDFGSKVQDGGGLVFGSMENLDHINHQFWYDDCEDSNSTKVTEHYVQGSYGVPSYNSDEDCTQNNTPAFIISGGTGLNISTDYITGTSAPEVIDITSAPTSTILATGLIYNGFSSTPTCSNILGDVTSIDGTCATAGNEIPFNPASATGQATTWGQIGAQFGIGTPSTVSGTPEKYNGTSSGTESLTAPDTTNGHYQVVYGFSFSGTWTSPTNFTLQCSTTSGNTNVYVWTHKNGASEGSTNSFVTTGTTANSLYTIGVSGAASVDGCTSIQSDATTSLTVGASGSATGLNDLNIVLGGWGSNTGTSISVTGSPALTNWMNDTTGFGSYNGYGDWYDGESASATCSNGTTASAGCAQISFTPSTVNTGYPVLTTTIPVPSSLASTIPVSLGGTGIGTCASGYVPVGAGTSAFQCLTGVQFTGSTNNILTIGANSAGNTGKLNLQNAAGEIISFEPATSGVSTYVIQPPPGEPTTSGDVWAGTAANPSIGTWIAEQGTIGFDGELGGMTTSAVKAAKMTNAGHFTELVCTATLTGSCTTNPERNVYDVTARTSGPPTSGLTTSVATLVTEAESLTFSAGDTIAIGISSAGSACTAPLYSCTATYTQP